MSLGTNIKYLRTKRNMTMPELGDIIGVSKQAIKQYELDVARPQPIPLVKMAQALGVTVEDLVLRTEWEGSE